MITYSDRGNFLLLGSSDGGLQIPKSTKNADYQKAMAEVAAGQAEIVPFVPALAERKKSKAAAAQAVYDAKIAAGRAHGGHTWQIDEASQNRVEAMGSLALAYRNADGTWDEDGWTTLWSGVAGGFVFISAANAKVTRTAQQMYELARAIGTYIAPLRYRLRDLKTAIAVAADQAALDAIDVSTGWPA